MSGDGLSISSAKRTSYRGRSHPPLFLLPECIHFPQCKYQRFLLCFLTSCSRPPHPPTHSCSPHAICPFINSLFYCLPRVQNSMSEGHLPHRPVSLWDIDCKIKMDNRATPQNRSQNISITPQYKLYIPPRPLGLGKKFDSHKNLDCYLPRFIIDS